MKAAAGPGVSLVRVRVPAVLIAAVTTFLATATVESSARVRARSYGAYLDLPELGVQRLYICDTGWLPANGGDRSAAASSYHAGSVLSLQAGLAVASRDEDCDDDDLAAVELGRTTLFRGLPEELRFTSLSRRDDDDCCGPDDDDFTATLFTGLTFAGRAVVVTGEPNQVVDVPGVGRLVINEVVRNLDDDCDDDDVTINALHLIRGSGGEAILGSTTYDEDQDCCPTGGRSTTWGRLKTFYR